MTVHASAQNSGLLSNVSPFRVAQITATGFLQPQMSPARVLEQEGYRQDFGLCDP